MYVVEDLTVFIMTHNRADLISETIKSFLNQSVSGFCICVVDNASEDNTKEIVEKYGVEYVRNELDLGPDGTSRKIQKILDTKLVMLFHDDDLIHPNYIESALKAFNKFDCDAVLGGNIEFDNENYTSKDLEFKKIKKYYYLKSKEDFAVFLYFGMIANFASMIYKTENFKKIDFGYISTFGKCGDRPLMIENVKKSVVIFDKNCVKYRQHKNSDMLNCCRGPFLTQIVNYFKFYKEILYSSTQMKYRFFFNLGLLPLVWYCYKWMKKCKVKVSYNQFIEQLDKKNIIKERTIFNFISKKILVFLTREIRNFLKRIYFKNKTWKV